MSKRGSFVGGGIFLCLFALPFFGVGVGMTWWQWRDVLRSREILSSWQTVPARIESAELKSHRGSKGGTTYRAAGSYRYVYQGRHYTSDVLSLSDGADNIGDFQQSLHREMRAAKNAGRPLDAHVNPADPAEAVLRPEWRPEMGLFKSVFGVVFGGVGAALFFGSIFSVAQGRRDRELRARHVDEPWRWRADWAARSLRPGHASTAAIAIGALIMLNAPTLPLWGALPAEWAAGGGFRWLLAGALGLVLVGDFFCIRALARVWRHYGLRLEIPEVPLRAGADMRLTVKPPRGLPAGSTLRGELKCIHQVTTGSGKRRSVKHHPLWTGETEATGPFFQGQPVELTFSPPAGLPSASSDPGAPDRHYWELKLVARGPGPDLVAKFELPVFSANSTFA